MDDLFMSYRDFQENGKTSVCHLLVFAGAPDMHVFVPVAPVVRQADIKALRAPGNKIELQIRALPHYCPGIYAPLVRRGTVMNQVTLTLLLSVGQTEAKVEESAEKSADSDHGLMDMLSSRQKEIPDSC